MVVKLNPYKESSEEETKAEQVKPKKKVTFDQEAKEPSQKVVYGQIESIVLPGCANKQHPTDEDLKQLQLDHENPQDSSYDS